LHLNPLVAWIWAGAAVMLLGAMVSLWPEVDHRRLGPWGAVRAAMPGAAALIVSLLVATGAASGALASPLGLLMSAP